MSILDLQAADQASRTPAASPPPHQHVVLRAGRAHAWYRRRGRWAIVSGPVHAADEESELALSSLLDVLRERRLRPLFTGLPDSAPYARRGLVTHHYADDAVLDLYAGDHLDRVADRRRELLAARGQLTVAAYRPSHHGHAVAALGGIDPDGIAVQRHCDGDEPVGGDEAWVAADPEGTVRGVAMWSDRPAGPDAERAETDGGGDTRWLRGATAHPGAAGPTAELLIQHAVSEFGARGVSRLVLGRRARAPWWGAASDRRGAGSWAAVERCRPRWCPRWLAVLSPWQVPAAAVVLRAGGGR